jgi:hypothetical protein
MLDVSIHYLRGATHSATDNSDVVRIDTVGGESCVRLFLPPGRGAAVAEAINAAAGRSAPAPSRGEAL